MGAGCVGVGTLRWRWGAVEVGFVVVEQAGCADPDVDVEAEAEVVRHGYYDMSRLISTPAGKV